MLSHMKYIFVLLFLGLSIQSGFSQNTPLDGFLDGKSVVLISSSPAARPPMTFKSLAEEIHEALIEAGGDPVAYYELENVALSEPTQAAYAASFSKRLIKNVVILTRKENSEAIIHIMPFTGDKNIVSSGANWSASSDDLEGLKEKVANIGTTRKSKNLLVVEIPEFLADLSSQEASNIASTYLPRIPLNLDVFKLGVPLMGTSGEWGFLTTFRYDLLGKSEEQILAEQQAEKEGLTAILEHRYFYEVEFLTSPRADTDLIEDRIQFVLMRLEGREGDLLENMGLDPKQSPDPDRIVIKYYIRFLVRNELYIGPVWDADPAWDTALINFLEQIVPD